MKTLIISLNSKYIHSSLAPWYLKAYCGNEYGEIKVLEFTINDSIDSITAAIYGENAEIACFACYIWNMEPINRVVEGLKKISPQITVVLGGPEVSYDSREILKTNSYIDYIIHGEGEEPFKLLLAYLHGDKIPVDNIAGLTYRNSGSVNSNSSCNMMQNLDLIPSPYTDEMLSSLGNRIAYYESSRGCPFSCSYCLSSTFEGVRYFSMDRVKQDLQRMMDAGIKLVKFVDRTFNSNKTRAKEIFRFIISNAGDTSFHFEAAADLFDDEMLRILSKAPPGLIQFEIGVQTTNIGTLKMINRKTSLEKVFENVIKLNELGNMHLHLDLIAGLPGEDYKSFKKSFDDVYLLTPHQLQLGFLKMLKGSAIREQAKQHGYQFKSYPPYEVLFNRYVSFDEMLELRGIEDLIERYYNSGRLPVTLKYLVDNIYKSPFKLYRDLFMFNREKGLEGKAMTNRDTYTAFLRFITSNVPEENIDILKDFIKLDYLSSDKSGSLPDGLEREFQPGFKELCFEFLKDARKMEAYLPHFANVPAKQIYKQVHFEVFNYDVTKQNIERIEKNKTVILFDYTRKDLITGLFSYIKVMVS